MFKKNSTAVRRPAAQRGWSLMEMMVAMMGGSTVLTTMLVTASALSNNMAAIANYNELSQASRNTLDTMSRDLRNTAVVTSLSASQVTLTNSITGDVVSYVWDGTNQLVRTFDGERKVMLTGCDTLQFEGYQRNPTNNLDFLPADSASETKLISVSWRCSRQILGAKINTESVQTAQICIRN